MSTGAVGISGNDIVGEYDGGDTTHGFLYNGSSYSTLDVPGANDSHACGISGNKIVGYYNDMSSVSHGFLYNGSSYTTLDAPGAAYTCAEGIIGNDIVVSRRSRGTILTFSGQ